MRCLERVVGETFHCCELLEKLKDIEIAGSQYANRAAILTEEYLG